MGDYMKFCSKRLFFIRLILVLLTLSVVIFIFSNSAQNAQNSSAASGRVTDFLNNICLMFHLNFTFTQDVVRTLAHFSEFGLLGVVSLLTALSFFDVKVKSLITSILFSAVVSVADECIQLFSDGRAFQFSDLIIDFSGLSSGIVSVFLIALLINYHRIKVQRRNNNGKDN